MCCKKNYKEKEIKGVLYTIDLKSWSPCSLLTWKPRRFFFLSGWIWCLFCSLARQQHWGISGCNLIKTIRLCSCLRSVAGMDLGRQMIPGAWTALTAERRWATSFSQGLNISQPRLRKGTVCSAAGKANGDRSVQAHQGSLWTWLLFVVMGVTCVSSPHNNGRIHSLQCVNSIKLCLCECWHERLG